MALKALNKINEKLQLLKRKNKFLALKLPGMLGNPLISPHFDYACSTWYPNFIEKLKKENTNQTSLSAFALNWTKGIIYPAKSSGQLTGYLLIKQCISA